MAERIDRTLVATTKELIGLAAESVTALREGGHRAAGYRNREYVTSEEMTMFSRSNLDTVRNEITDIGRRRRDLEHTRAEILPKALAHFVPRTGYGEEIAITGAWPLLTQQIDARVARGQAVEMAAEEALTFAHRRGDTMMMQAAHRYLEPHLDAVGTALPDHLRTWLGSQSGDDIATAAALDEISHSKVLYRSGVITGLASRVLNDSQAHEWRAPVGLIDVWTEEAIDFDDTAKDLEWTYRQAHQ